jgi:hypothetical protein
MLVNRKAWRLLRDETNMYLVRDRETALLRQLTANDVKEASELCTKGSQQEAYAALGVLLQLTRGRDPRLGDAVRTRVRATARQLTRKHYPNAALGVRAFELWRSLDAASADKYLVGLSFRTGINDDAWLSIVGSLSRARAVATLASLPRMPASAETHRRAYLDVLRPASDERLRELARAWRRTRSVTALSRAFQYLQKQRRRVHARDLIAALGRPTRRTEAALLWQPRGGEALLVVIDDEGWMTGYDFA